LDPFMDAWKRVRKLVGDLRTHGHAIRYVDLGGGLGIAYAEDRPPAPTEYGQAIADAVRGLDVTLLVEPGRSLVGNAGALLTRVLYLKGGASKTFVVVDAAMNDLIRPALYEAPPALRPVARPSGDTVIAVDVVGPVCESGDFLAHDRPLPPLAAGDLLAVMSAGAYGFVMASNYNARPRPAIALVDGERYDVVRARETIGDLLRGETIPASVD
jgi:diaminopimelate decarboxylase